MKKTMKIRRILLQLMITCLPLAGYAQQEFKNWPEGTSPEEIGRLVSKRFVEVPHPNFDGNPAPPNEITYPETCAWFGALRYADVTRNRELLKQLEERFLPIFGPERRLQPCSQQLLSGDPGGKSHPDSEEAVL